MDTDNRNADNDLGTLTGADRAVIGELQKILADLPSLAPEDATDLQKRALEITSRVITGKQTLSEAVGWGPEEVEGFYTVGYNLYNSGKFADAQNVFAICQMLSPHEFRYVFSLASCLQKQTMYADACLIYLLSAALAQDNPAPFLRMAECALGLGQTDAMLEMADRAMAVGAGKSEYAAIHERARVMQENARG